MLKITPVSFRVTVKPDAVKKTTDSGIVLAFDERAERNAYTWGTIIEVGEDAYTAYNPRSPNAGLMPGVRVGYVKNAGAWYRNPETLEEFLVLNDGDIVLKAEEVADATS